jgi:hypothetical protein
VVERTPSEAWLRRARELCDARGAVLVFDEMKTGFRLAPGGYQEVCGITPISRRSARRSRTATRSPRSSATPP